MSFGSGSRMSARSSPPRRWLWPSQHGWFCTVAVMPSSFIFAIAASARMEDVHDAQLSGLIGVVCDAAVGAHDHIVWFVPTACVCACRPAAAMMLEPFEFSLHRRAVAQHAAVFGFVCSPGTRGRARACARPRRPPSERKLDADEAEPSSVLLRFQRLDNFSDLGLAHRAIEPSVRTVICPGVVQVAIKPMPAVPSTPGSTTPTMPKE